MAPPSYTTLPELKTAIGIDSIDHDTELTDIIEQVSSLFDLIYGQTFVGSSFTEWHDGSHSQDGIVLDQIPEETGASLIVLLEDGQSLTKGVDFDLRKYPSRTITRLDTDGDPILSGFAPGTKNIRVTYDARFTVIPSDIARACIEESIRAWQARNSSNAADGARVGISQRSPESGTSLTYTLDDLSATTLRMLERYRLQRGF